MRHNTLSLFLSAGTFVGVWSNLLYQVNTLDYQDVYNNFKKMEKYGDILK